MAKDFRQPEELTTERLVLRKSVDERDLDRYLTDLKKTDEFYFQFSMERSDERALIKNIGTLTLSRIVLQRSKPESLPRFISSRMSEQVFCLKKSTADCASITYCALTPTY